MASIRTNKLKGEEAIWHDSIVVIRTGDAFADAVYNMERAIREYTLPQRLTINEDGTVTRG